MCIESLMPSSHLILCHPLLLPSVFPNIRVFSIESVLHVRWPKYWSFSFSVLPMNIHGWFPLWLTGLISLLSVKLLGVFSSITVQNYQFLSTQYIFIVLSFQDSAIPQDWGKGLEVSRLICCLHSCTFLATMMGGRMSIWSKHSLSQLSVPLLNCDSPRA